MQAVDYDPINRVWDNRVTFGPISQANGDFVNNNANPLTWPTVGPVGILGTIAVTFNYTTASVAQFVTGYTQLPM